MKAERVGGQVWCMGAGHRGEQGIEGAALKRKLCQKMRGVVELLLMQCG